ncbi:hypothetical protein ACEWY4_007362 [Coilia grayii]|uniref:Uncharacterized protein n=1 Tax=Coilia grayii TaxID=363190 RepID=A0ABD1KG18_9TELE
MSKVHQLSGQLQLALEVTETPSPEGKAPFDRQAKLCVSSLKDILCKIVFEENMDDLQNYLMSSDRTCLLSNVEELEMELRDCKQRHQVTIQGLHQSLHAREEHYKALITKQEQKLQSYDSQVQCLQQLLKVVEGDVEALQRTLQMSQEESKRLHQDVAILEEYGQVLRLELGDHEGHMQAVRQELHTVEESGQLLQRSLQGSEELCRSLQQQLVISEQKVQMMQEAAELWEGQAKSTEMQRELQKKELEAEHELEVKKITQAFNISREKLEGQQQEAQRSLKEAIERERSLRETLVTEQTKHQKEIQRAKEEKTEVEQALRGQIISLKNQLVDELSMANKKLEESAKYERELQNNIMDLRQALRQQHEDNSTAIDCLRRRHHDLARVQRLLQANIQSCTQASMCAKVQPHNAPLRAQSSLFQPQEVQQDLQEVKTQLDSSMKEWKKEAGSLVRLSELVHLSL